MADYSIDLGISVNTAELDKVENQIKSLNGTSIKIDIDANTKELTNTIKGALNSLSKGTKGALTLDTSKFESSLSGVKGDIAEIRNLLSSIGNGVNMKGLAASIGQIGGVLDKVSGKFEELNAEMRTLSTKDFSINLGVNLGGSNSVARQSIYGNKVRSETLPQLKQQVNDLVKYYNTTYKQSLNEFEALQRMVSGTKLNNGDFFENFIFGKDSVAVKMGNGSLSSQMQAYKQYIDMFKQAASLKGIDLSTVTSKFSKSADELIKDAQDIQTGAKEMENGFEKLKNIFGGSGIDGESLTRQLDSIVADLGEIKTAFQSLSSGISLEGLTASFDKLSNSIESIVENCNTMRSAIDNSIGDLSGSIGNTGLENVEGDLREVGTAAEKASDAIDNLQNKTIRTSSTSDISGEFKEANVQIRATEDQIDNLRTALHSFGFKNSSIESVLNDIKQVGFEVKQITHQLNDDGSVKITVKGVDDLNQAVTAIKSVRMVEDSLSEGDLVPEIRTTTKITQTFNEIEESFKRLKSLAKEMGQIDIKIAGLDTSKDADEIRDLTNLLNKLKAEYKGVYDSIDKNLDGGQIRELDQIFANTANSVREVRNELSKASEMQEFTAGFEKLKSITKEINSLEIELFKAEDVNDVERISSKIEELKSKASALRTEISTKFPNASFEEIDNIAEKGSQALAKLANDVAKAKAELAQGIKLDIEFGNYDNEISGMIDKFNKLSSASNELYNSKRAVEESYRQLKNAMNMSTGDEVADTERLIKAQEEYAVALEKTNNLIRIQAREEKNINDALKLQDNKNVFGSQIDAWLVENSAAAKQFGGAMTQLKSQIQSADAIQLNHLKSQFKQLDSAAGQFGVKGLSAFDKMKTKFKEYASYLSAAEVFSWIERGLESMFEQVRAVDSAMTELKKVTDESDTSYANFLDNATSRAKELGTTVDGLVSSTADFARLGYDFEDAQGLAEVANIYAVVGDDIENVEQATESLISTLAAFKDEMNGLSDSEFALSIVDKMNEVSNNFAISSGGLGEALKRSASSMAAANNSLDETIALITAANTVVQNPEKVGNGLKTISMRIRGAKTE